MNKNRALFYKTQRIENILYFKILESVLLIFKLHKEKFFGAINISGLIFIIKTQKSLNNRQKLKIVILFSI